MGKEDLQEELHALSTAYSTLEQMYNAVVEDNQTGREQVMSTSTGEDSSSLSNLQHGGEGTLEETVQQHQPSHEVVTLRQEIERLQQSGRAAEEWMSMAMQRMDDMNRENTLLKESHEKKLKELQSETNALLQQHQNEQQEMKNTEANSRTQLKMKEKDQKIKELEQA